ncbi:hypothetical protein DIPPA_01611, partial [Diplonema papillatum]
MSTFASAHARELQAHGIAQRGRGPNGLVVEEKEGVLRQRFILWTYDANAVVETDGYQAHVPLQHVSQYLEAVSEECGSTRDFRCGFYGIEIPIASLGLFAFQDDAGEWWELTRLPVGHSCAPELMHTVASTAAGHPEYVDGQYADVVAHVWVDNIRYAGPRDLVLAVTSRLDELASEAGMTWKAADTQTAAQRYEFIGVEWNHADGTVGVSRRMRSRLQRAEDAIEAGSMSASYVESLADRLLHASAITGVFVGEFYFVLKFFRRVTNALNRGEKAVDEKVVLRQHTAVASRMAATGCAATYRACCRADAGGGVGWTALDIASLHGHSEVVKELIAAGANVDVQHKDNGRTALHRASHNGHLQVVKELIAAGANVDVQSK